MNLTRTIRLSCTVMWTPGRKGMDFKQVQTSRIRRTEAGKIRKEGPDTKVSVPLFVWKQMRPARLSSPYPTTISY